MNRLESQANRGNKNYQLACDISHLQHVIYIYKMIYEWLQMLFMLQIIKYPDDFFLLKILWTTNITKSDNS